MRYKRRYVLLSLDNVGNGEDPEKMLFFTLNKMDPLLSIKSNFRVIKELTRSGGGKAVLVVSVNNEFKDHVIFVLSLIGKFYKSNMLTIKISGSLKKLKEEENKIWNHPEI